jgi:hypothetical protein
MTDHTPPADRLEELLRDAATTYNAPPDERHMPLESMWRAIEPDAFPRGVLRRTLHAPRSTLHAPWLRVAAALVLGIGIGRVSFSLSRPDGASRFGDSSAISRPANMATEATVTATPDGSTQPVDPATSRYLGQAAALLIALPSETTTGHADQRFIMRANELLLTTRLLLDSQAASEPGLRNLLEDLELVLVQVVRLQNQRDPSRRTDLELIQQALDQRDVLPRLRTAVSEHAADD